MASKGNVLRRAVRSCCRAAEGLDATLDSVADTTDTPTRLLAAVLRYLVARQVGHARAILALHQALGGASGAQARIIARCAIEDSVNLLRIASGKTRLERASLAARFAVCESRLRDRWLKYLVGENEEEKKALDAFVSRHFGPGEVDTLRATHRSEYESLATNLSWACLPPFDKLRPNFWDGYDLRGRALRAEEACADLPEDLRRPELFATVSFYQSHLSNDVHGNVLGMAQWFGNMEIEETGPTMAEGLAPELELVLDTITTAMQFASYAVDDSDGLTNATTCRHEVGMLLAPPPWQVGARGPEPPASHQLPVRSP